MARAPRALAVSPLRLTVILIWLVTSLSLAGWWLIFGLRQIERLSKLRGEEASEILRQHRMILWEGSFLFVLLLAGGVGLIYFMYLEARKNRQVKEFFARFTHDLKTSLASLRLQAEALEEDLRQTADPKLLRRLVKDTVRLELQLENSLFLANAETGQLHFERVRLQPVIASLSHHWPELKIEVDRDCELQVDMRALESILKNILQNAVVHGRAKRAVFHVEPGSGPTVHMKIEDDGEGFRGDVRMLGTMFARLSPRSGSGVGLYLACVLASRLGGALKFRQSEPGGLTVDLTLQGQVI